MSAAFFILYASGYLLISCVDYLQSEAHEQNENVRAAYGIKHLLASAGEGLLALFHYFFVRRVVFSGEITTALEPSEVAPEASHPHRATPDKIDQILREKLEIQRQLDAKQGENDVLMKQLAGLQANSRKTEHLAGDHSLAIKENKELRDRLKQKESEIELITMDRDNYANRVNEQENEADDLRNQVTMLQSQLRKYKRQGAGVESGEIVVDVVTGTTTPDDNIRQDLHNKTQLVLNLQAEVKTLEGYRQKAADLTVLLKEIGDREQRNQNEVNELRLKIERQSDKIRLLKQQLRETEQQAKANITVNTSEEYIRVIMETHEKQIKDLKLHHDQELNNLNADLDSHQQTLTDLRASLKKAQKDNEKLEDELTRLKDRKAEDEQDLKETRDQLRKLEDLLRAAKAHQSNLEREVERLTSDLNDKLEQLKFSEQARSNALKEISAQQGQEFENIKSFYDENLNRELERQRLAYESKIDSLRGDLKKQESNLEDLKQDLSDKKHELQATVRDRDAYIAEIEKLEKELEEMKHKFVHEETISRDYEQQVRKLRATEDTLKIELGIEKQKNTTLQDSFSSAMTDLEYRLNLSRESMKEKLIADHSQELAETSALANDRLKSMQAELIEKRQEAEKNARDNERLNEDLKTLVEQVSSLRVQYEQLKLEYNDLKSDREAERIKLEDRIAELEAELHRAKHDVEQMNSEASFRDDSTYYEAEIDRLKALLEEREQLLSKKDDSEYGTLILERDRQINELYTKLNSVESSEKEWKQEAERIRLDLQLQINLLNDEKQRLHNDKKRFEDELRVKEDALARKKSKTSTIKAQLLIVQEQRDKEHEVLRADHNLELERQKKLYTDNFTRDLDETKLLYQNRIEKLQGDINLLRIEVNDAAEKLGKALFEKSQAEKKIQELQRELAELQDEIEKMRDELRSLKQKAMVGDEERERLYKLQEILKRQLLDKEVQLEENSNTIQARTASQEKMLRLLNEQITDLRNSLQSKEKSLESVQKERDDLKFELNARHSELGSMSLENTSLHKELLEVRRSSPTRMSMSIMSGTSPLPIFEDEDITAARSEYSMQSVEETVILEGLVEIDVKRNPLVEKVSRLRREPPMTYSNMWKLLETLMLEKAKVDKLELALGRQCRPMVDFAADFMYLQAGLQSLSLKQLKALICSLEELYKSNHPYATFFCRLLGLFHPRPYSQHLSIFLLLSQEQFAAVERQTKNDSFAKHYDVIQYGGVANLLDVMELIMRIFKNHRETGEHIITHLTNSTDVEATLIKVCGTMARMGKDSEYIFDLLDLDNSGQLDYHEFVDGIRYNLNIWVTEEEAEQLCEHIDSEATGMVTRDEWGNRVDFETLASKAESDTFTSTKSNLLNAIVDEYEKEMLNDYYKLRHLAPNSLLSQDQFFELIESIDDSLDERTIQKLYDQALEKDRGHRGKISAEAFCTVVLKNKVGGYGHGSFELDGLSLDTPRESSRLTLTYSPARR
mmetsp:Transcript_584/g.906  ORF Transcript_584/g.906 Transcript_584/m.906 type:complete len:1484 (-) Transcript_584:98-4549(-)